MTQRATPEQVLLVSQLAILSVSIGLHDLRQQMAATSCPDSETNQVEGAGPDSVFLRPAMGDARQVKFDAEGHPAQSYAMDQGVCCIRRMSRARLLACQHRQWAACLGQAA